MKSLLVLFLLVISQSALAATYVYDVYADTIAEPQKQDFRFELSFDGTFGPENKITGMKLIGTQRGETLLFSLDQKEIQNHFKILWYPNRSFKLVTLQPFSITSGQTYMSKYSDAPFENGNLASFFALKMNEKESIELNLQNITFEEMLMNGFLKLNHVSE
jgi:hypothetical protein